MCVYIYVYIVEEFNFCVLNFDFITPLYLLVNLLAFSIAIKCNVRDKISNIALQFMIQKWPSCYATLKCRATSCNASLLILLIYIYCLFMS